MDAISIRIAGPDEKSSESFAQAYRRTAWSFFKGRLRRTVCVVLDNWLYGPPGPRVRDALSEAEGPCDEQR